MAVYFSFHGVKKLQNSLMILRGTSSSKCRTHLQKEKKRGSKCHAFFFHKNFPPILSDMWKIHDNRTNISARFSLPLCQICVHTHAHSHSNRWFKINVNYNIFITRTAAMLIFFCSGNFFPPYLLFMLSGFEKNTLRLYFA